MGGSSNSSQSSQSQTSYDPELKGLQVGNYAAAQQTAAQPFQAYTGSLQPTSNANLSGASSAADALAHFAPTTVTAPSIAADQVSTPGSVSADQIKGYMDPFTQNVVDTTNADLERQRLQQITQNQGAATAAGAYGGSRHGVVDSLTNEAAQRTMASTDANLRSQGYGTALTAAQADLARSLAAGQSNQSANLEAGKANQATTLAAGQSNQSASVAGAGIRQNAAGLLGSLGQKEQDVQQTALQSLYQEFLRGQNWGPMMQQLLNQAAGVIPSGTTGTSTGTGNSSSFQIGPQSVSVGI